MKLWIPLWVLVHWFYSDMTSDHFLWHNFRPFGHVPTWISFPVKWLETLLPWQNIRPFCPDKTSDLLALIQLQTFWPWSNFRPFGPDPTLDLLALIQLQILLPWSNFSLVCPNMMWDPFALTKHQTFLLHMTSNHFVLIWLQPLLCITTSTFYPSTVLEPLLWQKLTLIVLRVLNHFTLAFNVSIYQLG